MSGLQCSQGPFCQRPFLASFEKISGVQLPSSVKVWRHATVKPMMANSPAPWLDLARRWHGPLAAALARGRLMQLGLGDHQDGASP